jgi:hypothetical protein
MLQEIHNRMESVFANDVDHIAGSLDETPANQLQTHLRRPKWRRPSNLMDASSLSRAPSVEADAPYYRPRRCAVSCICRCHRCFRIRSPEALQKIFGTVFVELASLFILYSCNKGTCRQKSQSLLRLTYFFPQWLLMRMISATLWIPNLQACEISMKMPRVVPEDAEVFACARSGDIRGLRSLFDDGLASVHDTGVFTGACPITVRVGGIAAAAAADFVFVVASRY